jgi:hypothetical protein
MGHGRDLEGDDQHERNVLDGSAQRARAEPSAVV